MTADHVSLASFVSGVCGRRMSAFYQLKPAIFLHDGRADIITLNRSRTEHMQVYGQNTLESHRAPSNL